MTAPGIRGLFTITTWEEELSVLRQLGGIPGQRMMEPAWRRPYVIRRLEREGLASWSDDGEGWRLTPAGRDLLIVVEVMLS